MSRRYTLNEDAGLGGGLVGGLAFTVAVTLIAFFLADAGLFDPKPLARAGSPPRGDVVVFSNGEMAQVKPRLNAVQSSGWAHLRPISNERLAAKSSANPLVTR